MKEYKELVQLEVEEHDVLKLFNQLGPNAKNIVIHILERLAKGAKQYGDFDGQRRDWDKESSEEALDLAVYQAAKLLGLGKTEEPDGIERSAWTRTPREELYTFGHQFIGGKRYTRFHDGPSRNPRVTLVDSEGRTPDGKPWVPPAGARVRVVHRCLDFAGFQPNVGYVGTVLSAEKYDTSEISVSFPEYGEKLCRVVPA